jgi:RNA polymerase sigma-70 factor, ECF subfamily
MANDDGLVLRAQQGDMAAFAVLVNRHSDYVYNLALRVIHNPEEAQELAQEAFIRAWRGLPNFQRNAQFHTWLYRIVVNLCYNRLPRLRQELAILVPDIAALELADPLQQVEANLLSTELKALLHRAIDDLPEHYRLLITLRHLQELSYNEIVEVTGLPLGTVKTGIHRARALLRSALESYEGEA